VTTGALRRAKVHANRPTNKPTPNFLQAGCPSCHPTNSVKALKLITGFKEFLNRNLYM